MLGAILGAGASLLGSWMNSKSQDKNIQLQKDFAQSGIQWRVADAKKAGVHPLYALGASTTSFSPVSVGGGLGDGISAAGQNIGRAIDAANSPTAKLAAVQGALTTERLGLENDLLRSQIARLNQSPVSAGIPSAEQRWRIDGQGQTAQLDVPAGVVLTKNNPLKVTPPDPTSPYTDPAAISDRGFARTKEGYAVIPSSDVKERIEDMPIQEFQWALRNNIIPDPPYEAPSGKTWQFNPFTGVYKLVDTESIPYHD